MKKLILSLLILSLSTQAKIYDAFMCYTTFDTVVLFGILKPKGTLRINYHALDQNPTTIDLKINRYQRSDKIIEASGIYRGKEIIQIRSNYGVGSADIDLSSFPGTSDTLINDEDVLCYFGKFEE